MQTPFLNYLKPHLAFQYRNFLPQKYTLIYLQKAQSICGPGRFISQTLRRLPTTMKCLSVAKHLGICFSKEYSLIYLSKMIFMKKRVLVVLKQLVANHHTCTTHFTGKIHIICSSFRPTDTNKHERLPLDTQCSVFL